MLAVVKVVWGFAAVGLLPMLLGVFVAGGTTVICTRTGAPAESAEPQPAVIGSCRVQSTRWLGRKVIEERTYPRVTGVTRTSETTRDSKGSSTTWSLHVWSREVEVEEISAPRDQVDASHDAAQAWFGGAAAEPLVLDLTQWRFAYGAMGFGALWTGLLLALTRGRE